MSFQFRFKLVKVFSSSYFTRNGIQQLWRGNAEGKVAMRSVVYSLELLGARPLSAFYICSNQRFEHNAFFGGEPIEVINEGS